MIVIARTLCRTLNRRASPYRSSSSTPTCTPPQVTTTCPSTEIPSERHVWAWIPYRADVSRAAHVSVLPTMFSRWGQTSVTVMSLTWFQLLSSGSGHSAAGSPPQTTSRRCAAPAAYVSRKWQ